MSIRAPLTILSVVLLVAACGPGGATAVPSSTSAVVPGSPGSEAAVASLAPTVRSLTPPDGAVNVGNNAPVIVRFSEPINPTTVNGSTITISAPSGAIETSVSVANGNRDVHLTPYAPLPDGQTVTVTIGGVTDLSGNGVAPMAIQFAVGPGPDVLAPMAIATNPVNGLVNVPTNAVIALLIN